MQNHKPQLNGHDRRRGDFLLYEHGEKIAHLSARADAHDEWRGECKTMMEEMRKSQEHFAAKVQASLKEMEATLSASAHSLQLAITKINERAWTTGKILSIGGAILVAVGGGVAWLSSVLGATIHFGG